MALRSAPRRAGAAAVVLLVAGVAASWPVLSGRTAAVPSRLDAARAAVIAAQQEDAAAWAPGALARAEDLFRQALVEHRRQELRFVLLRDYRRARRLLEAVARATSEARTACRVARAAAIAEATSQIERAERSVRRSSAFARAMHVPPAERSKLLRARIAVQEARIRLRDGDPLAAADAAQAAMDWADPITSRASRQAARFSDAGLLRLWQGWVAQTIAASRHAGAAVVVDKDAHQVTLYRRGRAVRTWPADLGYNSVQDKLAAGDGATPEGRYRIVAKKDRGSSVFHRALLLDYPNAEDRREFARARRAGAIAPGASPGGLIELHGHGGRGKDWTRGCVALRNGHMDELFAQVGVGTPVTIVGAAGDRGRLASLVAQHPGEGR